MASFSYSTVKQQVVDSAKVTPGKHTVRLTRMGAVLNKNQEPMSIVTTTIEDNTDKDDGKEVVGFLSFPEMFGDLQLQSLENFMRATDCSWDTLNDQVITVDFLKQWGIDLVGTMLTIESGYGSGTYAEKPVIKNFYPLGAAVKAPNDLIDLD